MQKLAMFIFKATLKQCENLNDEVLKRKLQIEEDKVDYLVKTLHEEHVIRFKYTFNCPYCDNLNTVYEGGDGEELCQFCSKPLDVNSLKQGATIRYILDKDDFEEYMDEYFKNELVRAKEGKIIETITTKNEENEKFMTKENTERRLFISHSSLDKEYVEALVDFLQKIGMSNKNMFCSSVEGYKIPWGNDIYDYLASEFNNKNDLLVLFVLSDNYYKSPACLNEMGAAWVLKKEYRSILLPGFDYKEIEGAINPRKIGIKLDDDDLMIQLNDIKDQFEKLFEIKVPNGSMWDNIRRNFQKKLKDLKYKSHQ